MKTTRLLLLLPFLLLTACNTPNGGGSGEARPRPDARYVYNPATNSYEWQQGDRIVTGAYQP